jgi:hypothetical protein
MMKTFGLAVTLIVGAIVIVSIPIYLLECYEARRLKKRTWSDREHDLLAQSITFIK